MPPPLSLPPPPLADRPAPRRWPGYVALAVVVCGLTLLLGSGLRVVAHIQAAESRSEAGSRIKAVLTAQQEAWNRGDLDGFMAGYWSDERLTFASGDTVTRGWQATMDRYRKRYQADGKEMGTLTFSDLEVELLGPATAEPTEAVVLGRWGLTFAKSADTPNGLFTLLVRWTPDGWKVAHDHTSAAEVPKKD